MRPSCHLCARWFVVGCVEFDWVVGWVGLWVQSFLFAIGWVGLKKLDPRTTPIRTGFHRAHVLDHGVHGVHGSLASSSPQSPRLLAVNISSATPPAAQLITRSSTAVAAARSSWPAEHRMTARECMAVAFRGLRTGDDDARTPLPRFAKANRLLRAIITNSLVIPFIMTYASIFPLRLLLRFGTVCLIQ